MYLDMPQLSVFNSAQIAQNENQYSFQFAVLNHLIINLFIDILCVYLIFLYIKMLIACMYIHTNPYRISLFLVLLLLLLLLLYSTFSTALPLDGWITKYIYYIEEEEQFYI